jgi:hypothetical protein
MVRIPHLARNVGVDPCISYLVHVLNQSGFATRASCCGHGQRPGSIILADGRELMIVPDYETGRRIDDLFARTLFPWTPSP